MTSYQEAFDHGVQAAANMLTHLAKSARKEEERIIYNNCAKWVKELAHVDERSDNPYACFMVQQGIEVTPTNNNVIPLPQCHKNNKWVLIQTKTELYIVARASGLKGIRDDLQGRDIESIYKMPKQHWMSYGIEEILILNPEQIDWPPVLIESERWKYKLLEDVKASKTNE